MQRLGEMVGEPWSGRARLFQTGPQRQIVVWLYPVGLTFPKQFNASPSPENHQDRSFFAKNEGLCSTAA